MNLPYIQSELFRELVGLETLFKPEHKWDITRSKHDQFLLKLVRKMTDEEKPEQYKDNTYWCIECELSINPFAIKNPSDITAEINRIWESIPAECKRDNILK